MSDKILVAPGLQLSVDSSFQEELADVQTEHALNATSEKLEEAQTELKIRRLTRDIEKATKKQTQEERALRLEQKLHRITGRCEEIKDQRGGGRYVCAEKASATGICNKCKSRLSKKASRKKERDETVAMVVSKKRSKTTEPQTAENTADAAEELTLEQLLEGVPTSDPADGSDFADGLSTDLSKMTVDDGTDEVMKVD